MQTGIKDKKQNKPCTLKSISRQREALYLYRVKIRFTGPRLDYLPEGGLISLPDRPHFEKQYADELSANQDSNSCKAKADIFFFIFWTLLRGVIWHIVSLGLG